MEYYGDYHTHTVYSDGVSKVWENVKAATDKGLKELAFTDHGFNSPSYGALTRKQFYMQREEIAQARKRANKELEIYHGIEVDIIGLDGSIGIRDEELEQMEILVMGYHSFAKTKSLKDWFKIFPSAYLSFLKKPSCETIARNTKTYINAIKKYPIDILAHINHMFKVDCVEVAKACRDYGTYVELNAKHMNLSAKEINDMSDTGVKFIASSDAHHFSKIGGFEKLEEVMKHIGFDKNKLVNYNKKPEFPRKKQRIKEL
ncbi:MAG: PHP domain-containing protein [Bacillota bacterium]